MISCCRQALNSSICGCGAVVEQLLLPLLHPRLWSPAISWPQLQAMAAAPKAAPSDKFVRRDRLQMEPMRWLIPELRVPCPLPGLNPRHPGVAVLVMDEVVLHGFLRRDQCKKVLVVCSASLCLAASWERRSLTRRTESPLDFTDILEDPLEARFPTAQPPPPAGLPPGAGAGTPAVVGHPALPSGNLPAAARTGLFAALHQYPPPSTAYLHAALPPGAAAGGQQTTSPAVVGTTPASSP